jgi:hypothetical protein
MASYQPPGGEAVPFIQKGFRFSGGQSQDTAEYPFGGLWSNEYLNEKPQTLTVEGYVRGPSYIPLRNKLIEALRVPTDDDNPGYIDLPFWGRFPVVVGDTYEVSENADEQGQCAISITFTRAGVSAAERMAAIRTNTKEGVTAGDAAFKEDTNTGGTIRKESITVDGRTLIEGGAAGSAAFKENITAAAAALTEAAVKDFEGKVPETVDANTLLSGFLAFRKFLLSLTGKIQAARTKIDAVVNTVTGTMNLIAGIIRSPRDLAADLINACGAVVAALAEIKNSLEFYGGDDGDDSPVSSYPPPDSNNEKNALLMFLSVKDFSLNLPAETDTEQAAIAAMENLFRTAAFAATARILPSLDRVTYQKIRGYWNLLERLEESIDTENPLIYAALTELRIAVSRELASWDLRAELTRRFPSPLPLLYLARYLGCDESRLRELNTIADSFVISGEVTYV